MIALVCGESKVLQSVITRHIVNVIHLHLTRVLAINITPDQPVVSIRHLVQFNPDVTVSPL